MPRTATARISGFQHDSADLPDTAKFILPVIRAEVETLPHASVIADAGSGNGSMLAQLRTCGFELHGLEVSESGLHFAKQAYPGIDFSYGDLMSDFSSHPLVGKCDVVISTEVVEHLFLPRIFARNCLRLLRSGGRLIISTPYHGYAKNLALALTGKLDQHFTALWDHGHIKFWSRRTLSALLVEAGFEEIRFCGVGRIPYFWKSMILIARKP